MAMNVGATLAVARFSISNFQFAGLRIISSTFCSKSK
jgi:hypothetical protein